MTLFDGTLQDSNENTGLLSQTVCSMSAASITTNIPQCLICLSIWRVTSKPGQFTLQLTACSDQGWHIDSGHLCPAKCLRYVNHKWISDVAYAMFLLKLNDHYPTPIDIPSPYLSNHLPLMWYKQSYLRWGMFWKLQMKYSHLISLKQAIPVCLLFVYISFRQVILRSHRKWDIFFRTGVNEVTKLMT